MVNNGEATRFEDTVLLEFYSKDDGSDQFTVELTKEEFERYQLAAENMGIPFEELIVKAVEAELDEQNTQWVIPQVDSDGNIILDSGAPFELPDPAQMVPNEEGE